jgi:Predicted AAA-ATPase/PD-(D/E)XK nuclease superfamily
MPPLPILIGSSDFPTLREDGYLYVDKSRFISEVLARGAQVQLYPRPRRFGKTLSMSMLQSFLEIGPDRSTLFSDLKVWQDPAARRHFQKYAVVSLSFRGVKGADWAETREGLRRVVGRELERLEPLWSGPGVSAGLVQKLREVKEGRAGEQGVLVELTAALRAATGQRVVILIDEYDGPILHAWTVGTFDPVADWFRSFLTEGLKDNPHLYRGVLTGVLRVAKESMFSSLNNVKVYSLLDQNAELFGFTEAEVDSLLKQYGREGDAEEIRRWYNGYRFGDSTVYNPWSILHVLGAPDAPLQPYWLSTAGRNDLVRELLLKSADLHGPIASLLQGGTLTCRVDENVVLRDMNPADVWSLLLFSGYLKAVDRHWEEGRLQVTVAIPNAEVASIWRDTFVSWLERAGSSVEPLHQALLTGNADNVQELLQKLLLRHVSYHDVAETQAEAFYHAFVLGLLVTLEKTHRVLSNREVGQGRADVLVLPKTPGQPGVVLEFKKQTGKGSLATHAAAALRQISARGYAAELEEAGAAPIQKMGISFAGKEIVVKGPKKGHEFSERFSPLRKPYSLDV